MKIVMKSMLFMMLLGGLAMLSAQPSSDNTIDDGGQPSAVPEPSTMLIMGAGLAGVAFLGWKRNKKK